MEPSNFRYDPYNDIPTSVEITERHIIPANSPYYIRLNEVPQKESPSTITVKEITDIAESVTYGKTFTEVAANPAAGEFWADCNTGANGDENWNTGLITFNAADAGKIIEVTYMGTGTLAAVQSNRWPEFYIDRGTGSDGDFVPAENTTISGVKNYKSVFIKEGITVTVKEPLILKSLGLVIIEGTLSGAGTDGGNAGQSPGQGGYYGGANGASVNDNGTAGKDGTGGGAGGAGVSGAGGASGATIFSQMYGGGGAGGGSGDGGVKEDWDGAGGGGGGMPIAIIADSVWIKSTGAILTHGGKGGNGSYQYSKPGGGGGGGDCFIIANTIINNGNVDTSGGAGGEGASAGQAGRKIIKELGAL